MGSILILLRLMRPLGDRDQAFENLELLITAGYKNDRLLDRSAFDEIRSDPLFVALRRKMTPSYDIWTSMFLFVSLQGLFVSILFFWKKKRSAGHSHLLAILLFTFCNYYI